MNIVYLLGIVLAFVFVIFGITFYTYDLNINSIETFLYQFE